MKNVLCALMFVNLCFSQNTYVPDDNFEQTLIDLGYDSGPLDDFVLTSNINALTYINLSEKNISDLTGIEDFIALDDLDCYLNNLTSLDLSNNVALRKVSCYSNQLTSLNVSNLTNLEELWCYNNQLTTIDVTTNSNLERLSCLNNQLTHLNTDFNPSLQFLWCYDNELLSLNLANNSLLETLWCSSNSLTSLDLTSNTALTHLLCYSNDIEALDLSNNTSLVYLHCYSNALTTLNVKNGNNLNVTNFDASNNADLNCITVDDADWSMTNWPNIDSHSSFSDQCDNLSVETFTRDNVVITPNPSAEHIVIHTSIGQIKSIVIVDILGQIIKQTTRTTINLSDLQVGTYFLRIDLDKGLITKKVIKK